MRSKSETLRKVIILYVDYDDDLSEAGLKTPLIGYEEVLNTALKLALERPEDSDVNALFTALKLYNDVKEEGFEAEIAAIAGDKRGGIRAYTKLRKELENILTKTSADAAIAVCDSIEDEKAIPIIQSFIPVIDIKRVVVEQQKSVEATYILIGRYIRKALQEPRFAKIFLGYPGLLIIASAILSYLNMSYLALVTITLGIGLLMVVKGFGIDKAFISWIRGSAITAAALIASIVILAIAMGFTWIIIMSEGSEPLHRIIGSILNNTLWFYIASATIAIIAKIILDIISRSITVWRDLAWLIAVILTGTLLAEIGRMLSTLPHTPTVSDLVRLIRTSYTMPTVLTILAILVIMGAVLYYVEKVQKS